MFNICNYSGSFSSIVSISSSSNNSIEGFINLGISFTISKRPSTSNLSTQRPPVSSINFKRYFKSKDFYLYILNYYIHSYMDLLCQNKLQKFPLIQDLHKALKVLSKRKAVFICCKLKPNSITRFRNASTRGHIFYYKLIQKTIFPIKLMLYLSQIHQNKYNFNGTL